MRDATAFGHIYKILNRNHTENKDKQQKAEKFEQNIFYSQGDRDSRVNLMPIYGDLYQIKL